MTQQHAVYPPTEPQGNCRRRPGAEPARRGLLDGKPGEAGAREAGAGKREPVAPAPVQVHACAVHAAAQRPPQSGPGLALPGPRRSGKLVFWRLSFLKSLSPFFWKSGSARDRIFFLVNIGGRRAERGLAPPLTWVCLLINKNIQLSLSGFCDKCVSKSFEYCGDRSALIVTYYCCF